MEDVNRRVALKQAALLAGGAVLAPGVFACVRAETEPDGGAQRTRNRLEEIGLQLYTVRDLMAEDPKATLAAVAEIGYGEVETAGLHGVEPERFRAVLDQLRLESPAGHVGIASLREDLDGELATARTLGQRWIVVPATLEAERSLAGYRRIATELNRFGAIAAAQGRRMAYHNHDYEFEQVDSDRTGFEVLPMETDPDLGDFELDLFWAVKGGQDPVALFRRYPGRFRMCHVKDMLGIGGAERMVDVGDGDIDFAEIFVHAHIGGLQHFFVERDRPDDSIQTIRASYAYLRGLEWEGA